MTAELTRKLQDSIRSIVAKTPRDKLDALEKALSGHGGSEIARQEIEARRQAYAR